MNRGQLKTMASLLLADPNKTRYSDTQYNDALNIANYIFATDSRCLFKDSSSTVSAADATYALPSDFMWEKKVTLAGLRLSPISRDTLERIKVSDDWTDDSGTPKYYLIDPEEARKQVLLYPIPTSNEANKTLILTYYCKPSDMGTDSTDPLNGDTYLARFHPGIAYYAAWLLNSYENPTPETQAKDASLWRAYQQYINDARDTFENTISEPWNLRGGRNMAT